MRVEMSLAEMLLNAISTGRVRGVQFKRAWSDDRATFDDLKAVIGKRLDAALDVARANGARQLQEEYAELRRRLHAEYERKLRAGESGGNDGK